MILVDLDALAAELKHTFTSPDMGGLTTGGGSDPYWYAQDVLAVLEEAQPIACEGCLWFRSPDGARDRNRCYICYCGSNFKEAHR